MKVKKALDPSIPSIEDVTSELSSTDKSSLAKDNRSSSVHSDSSSEDSDQSYSTENSASSSRSSTELINPAQTILNNNEKDEEGYSTDPEPELEDTSHFVGETIDFPAFLNTSPYPNQTSVVFLFEMGQSICRNDERIRLMLRHAQTKDYEEIVLYGSDIPEAQLLQMDNKKERNSSQALKKASVLSEQWYSRCMRIIAEPEFQEIRDKIKIYRWDDFKEQSEENLQQLKIDSLLNGPQKDENFISKLESVIEDKSTHTLQNKIKNLDKAIILGSEKKASLKQNYKNIWRNYELMKAEFMLIWPKRFIGKHILILRPGSLSSDSPLHYLVNTLQLLQNEKTINMFAFGFSKKDKGKKPLKTDSPPIETGSSSSSSQNGILKNSDDGYSSDEDKVTIVENCTELLRKSSGNKSAHRQMLHAVAELLNVIASASNSPTSTHTQLPLRYLNSPSPTSDTPAIGFRFVEKFSEIKTPIQLIYGISLGNRLQCGPSFKAFVDLVNNNKNIIFNLVILDTTYLNRHYSKRYTNKEHETLWHKENKQALADIETEYKYVTWDALIKDDRDDTLFLNYDEAKRKIVLDYYGSEKENPDEEFVKIVNGLSKKISSKSTETQSQEAAIKYLLEECSGVLALSGVLTYPGPFNDAINYAVNKHKKDGSLTLLPHREQSAKEKLKAKK